jgi:hypothetical protein
MTPPHLPPRPAALAALMSIAVLGVSGCGGVGLTRETRYTGPVSPDGACGTASQGTLSTRGNEFVFLPSDGVIMMRGTVGADGAVGGTFTSTGADHKPYVMTFAGKVGEDHVTGRYITPRCTFTVSLDRHVTSLL